MSDRNLLLRGKGFPYFDERTQMPVTPPKAHIDHAAVAEQFNPVPAPFIPVKINSQQKFAIRLANQLIDEIRAPDSTETQMVITLDLIKSLIPKMKEIL